MENMFLSQYQLKLTVIRDSIVMNMRLRCPVGADVHRRLPILSRLLSAYRRPWKLIAKSMPGIISFYELSFIDLETELSEWLSEECNDSVSRTVLRELEGFWPVCVRP